MMMDPQNLPESLRHISFAHGESRALTLLEESWTEGFPPALVPHEDTAFVISVPVPKLKAIQESVAFKSLSPRQGRHLINYSDDLVRRHKCMAHLLREKLKTRFPDPRWQFNTSHSGGWVVVAWAGSAVGVDTQRISDPKRYPAVSAKLFPPDWQAILTSLEEEAEYQNLFFTWCWTALEAQFKLEQGDLLLPFLKEVAQEGEAWERTVHLDHFRVDDRYLACLARSRKAPPPRLYRLSADQVLNLT